jgi:hypothetical protein
MREEDQGVIVGAGAERTAIKSPTPFVYVPRRFRIGGIEGIPTGAAIVGTPQGDGMVAIDVESRPDLEPNPEMWTTWISEAAGRHVSDEHEPSTDKRRRTRFVSEAALVEVGRWIKGRVSIDDPAKGAELSRWIQAGRADYVVEAPFPHEV